MYDSLNPEALPSYRIPVNITQAGNELKGYLRPVDTKQPPVSYIVVLNDHWVGTLHHFKVGWQIDNQEYAGFVEKLGEVVTLWYM